MHLSIIMPFLNSHEIVRRQILWFDQMNLPDDVEILFMDDGSDPPIVAGPCTPKNFHLIATNDFRPWTSSLARNRGARLATGEYLLLTDGDYILTEHAIRHCCKYTGDRLGFRRQFAVLDEQGRFTQDRATLIAWGLPPSRFDLRKGLFFSPHPNNFVIRRELFLEMGGYDEQLILSRGYPQREDTHFKRKYRQWVSEGRIKEDAFPRTTIYMFPNGQFCGDVDYNPFGLFHTLTRKTPTNHWYAHPRYPKESKV